MVLPGTWSAALLLIIISIICFGLWPNIFKLAGPKWRFELFSFDFAAGAVLVALIAAYTLGTLGSDLDFSDSMLVAGRRAEAMAVGAGAIFAFGNMLYLGTVALLGLSNGTLLTFGVFGCALGLLQLAHGHYITAISAFLLLAITAALAIASAKAKGASQAAAVGSAADTQARLAQTASSTTGSSKIRSSPARSGRSRRGAQPQAQKPLAGSTKGTITGILAGLVFAGVVPVLALAQTEQLGIGAYGGMLLATIGVLIATFFLNFFFLNVSLEGGRIKYSTYFTGTLKNHVTGAIGGAVWAAGALALYAAFAGTAGVTRFSVWIAVFSGAMVAVVSGLVLWQKTPQPKESKRTTLIAAALFVVGIAVFLAGVRIKS